MKLCLEVFMATELDKFSSGRHPQHQMNLELQLLGDQIHVRHQGDVK